MDYQYKRMSLEVWQKLSLPEQMANIGSEVSRALNWRNKNKDDLSKNAVIRALDLLSLTISLNTKFSRLKELTRLKEALLDYFYGTNEFASSEILWRKYFDHFSYLARKKS